MKFYESLSGKNDGKIDEKRDGNAGLYVLGNSAQILLTVKWEESGSHVCTSARGINV